MQTIGKYVAAFILALTSSYFGPSENSEINEKEVLLKIRVNHSKDCTAGIPLFESNKSWV